MNKALAVLRRRWRVLLVALVAGVAVGGSSIVIVPARTSVTWSVAQVIFLDPTQLHSGVQAGTLLAQNALLVTRTTVTKPAAAALADGSTPDEVGSRMSAVVDTPSSTIQLHTSDTDQGVATRRITKVTEAFLAVINHREQDRLLREKDGRVDDLKVAQTNLATFDAANPLAAKVNPYDPTLEPGIADAAVQRGDLAQKVSDGQQQIDELQTEIDRTAPFTTIGPESPVPLTSVIGLPGSLPARLALFGVLGTMLDAALVLLLERIFPRIDDRRELVAATSIPVLVEVPAFAGLRHNARGQRVHHTVSLDGPWAEPYRRLRSAIRFVESQPGPNASHDASVGEVRKRAFMIASAGPAEAKSTTVALTGLALAELDHDVVVVGADFRRPRVENLLGVTSEPTIQDMAALNPDRPDVDEVVTRGPARGLWLAPAGPPTSEVAALGAPTRRIIDESVSRGATVLIDTPPLLIANDAIDLLPSVDQVIMVVRSGRVTVRALLSAIEIIEQHGGSIMGMVLTGTRPPRRASMYYGYGYEYGRGGRSDADGQPSGRPDQGLAVGAPNGRTPHTTTVAG